MTETTKPLHKYNLYDWQGDEHAKDCPASQNPEAECAEIEAYEDVEIGGIVKKLLTDACCPSDLVVLASKKPFILQAEAHPQVKNDSPRIEQGDRRRGEYYTKLVNLPVGTGLLFVKGMSKDRLAELEKVRQIRTGDRPADWVLKARRRAADGHDPESAENAQIAMANLHSAARRW